MPDVNESFSAKLHQQILSDRLLGVRSIPLPPLTAVGASARTSSHMPARGRDATHATGESDHATLLAELDEGQVRGCTKCVLCKTRTQTVFGQGNPNARLVFVGEAPGFEEDRAGIAFVGRSGQLLTRMIVAGMGLTREDVFICNVLKCRPPNNRDPAADEILACSPYLRRQIEIIAPEVMIALGAPAARTLLNTTQPIGKLRGRFHDYYVSGVTGEGSVIPLMPTYHPSYLLRDPSQKGKAWADIQMVMQHMGLKPPTPQ